MAVNIGPRIGIEGEAEYRKQINNITQAQKTLDAEMKATSAAFDENTTAQEKNAAKAKNLQQQVDNQKKKVEQLKHMTEQSAAKFGENSTQTLKWREALANAETELARMNTELDKVSKSDFSSKMQSAGQSLETLGGKMASVGDWMTTNITQPLMDVGKYCTDAYKEVDSAMDIIVKKTGATGEELEDMKKTAKDIAKTIPVSFEKSAKAVGEVNTRFGVTGDELEDLSTYFLEFSELNGTDVSQSVDDVSKAMKAFGVDTKDAKKVLDIMNATGQRTGVSMSTLSGSMVKNAASLQEMGMDVYQASQFLGDLEMSGADAATVMTGLRTAMTHAAENGQTLPEALAEFQSVMDSSASDQEKLNAAIELFGSKAGPAIYNACKNGSLSFASLDDDAQKHMGNVETTYENTLGPDSEIVTTMNKLKDTGAEIGETLLTILAPAVEQVGEYIGKLGEWYNGLDETQQKTVASVGMALAVGGPIIMGLSRVITWLGTVAKKAGEASGLMGGLAASGPIFLTAAAVGALALAIKDIDYGNVEGYNEWMSRMDELQKAAEETRAKVDQIGQNAANVVGQADAKAEPVQFLLGELNKCFDADGRLNVGMEDTAELIMGKLNEAMGTDLSTDFTEDMGANKRILEDTNKAAQDYIQNLRNMAVQQAFNESYGEAIQTRQNSWKKLGDSQQAYYEKLGDVQAKQAEIDEQQAIIDDWFSKPGATWDNASRDVNDAAETLNTLYHEMGALRDEADKAKETWLDNAEATAGAASEVHDYEEAMAMMLSNDPEQQAKAVDLFANMGVAAEENGKKVRESLGESLKDVDEALDNIADQGHVKDVSIEIINAEAEAKEAKNTVTTELANIVGTMVGIYDVSTVTQNAKNTIEKALTGLTGSVEYINTSNAVVSAWNSMQGWLNDNPLTSWVRQVTTNVSNGGGLWNSIWGHADGGIMTSPHVGLVAEAGPEAIIPLSSARRGRAMSLYREVGGILGVGSGSVTSNTNNSVNINVYASPTQTADEIAEVVSRKINTQLRRKGAVFA